MHAFAPVLAVLTAFATFTAASPVPFPTQVVTPNKVPTFETLFFAEIVLGPFDTFLGPFGTRINVPLLPEGSFKDPSGKTVATMLGGSVDGGLVSASQEFFFPDMKMALQFVDDQKFMSFSITGVGKLHESSLMFAHVETDSPSRLSLNGRFIMGNITFPETGNPTITFYGAL